MKEIEIPYQDDEILVVNKPCGVSTQGGYAAGMSLDEILERQTGKKVYLVHRLDRETAGLIIAAKSSAAASKWTRLVSCKAVQKEYIAICIGNLPSLNGTISFPIRQRSERGIEEKDAVTKYTVIASNNLALDIHAPSSVSSTVKENKSEIVSKEHFYSDKKIVLSIVKCNLLTGRKHQLRIHLSKLGTPIAGDDKYGNFSINRLLKKVYKLRHLCLASTSLTLPMTENKGLPALSYVAVQGKDTVKIEVPPPPHIRELISIAGMDILKA